MGDLMALKEKDDFDKLPEQSELMLFQQTTQEKCSPNI